MRAIAWQALLVLLPLSVPSVALSQVTDDSGGSGARSPACAGDDLPHMDVEMGRIWKVIVAKYGDRPLFLDKLRTSQRLWLAFREAELKARFPTVAGERPTVRYGSAYRLCARGLRAKLDRQRIDQLRVWVDGIEEGDVCSGSVKRPSELK